MLDGCVVAFWSLTEDIAGLNYFFTNTFVTEFGENSNALVAQIMI